MTETNSFASCRERVTSSSVWQCAQPRIDAFCSSVPGKLASHSALVSCDARSRAFVSFRSAVVVRSARQRRLTRGVEVVADGPDAEGVVARLEPCARKTIAALPIAHDGRRDGGAGCFALTSTPSIGPSSAEVTCPVRATARLALRDKRGPRALMRTPRQATEASSTTCTRMTTSGQPWPRRDSRRLSRSTPAWTSIWHQPPLHQPDRNVRGMQMMAIRGLSRNMVRAGIPERVA